MNEHAVPEAGGGERLAVAFARALRRRGLPVSVDAVATFVQALAIVGLHRRSHVYWAGRCTLVHRVDDIAAYDTAFDAFWLGEASDPAAPGTPDRPMVAEVRLGDHADGEGPPGDANVPAPSYSAAEVLRHKDFASYSPAELEESRRVMTDLRLAGALRRSRRQRRTRRPHGDPDLRGTLRLAVRSGGEPLRRSQLERVWRRRRTVVLCDVSGSMEPYARPLARFMHAAVAGGRRVEAFAVGTRLTRITRELAWRDPDVALADAARAVVDWSGGTRLGEGLRAFNDRWGLAGMARGAVVVILSDGWDRGDPSVLGEQMARLHRVAHRVVWVNPLKASPGYVPLAKGMAAALPYVDDFVEGHSLASLQTLATIIDR